MLTINVAGVSYIGPVVRSLEAEATEGAGVRVLMGVLDSLGKRRAASGLGATRAGPSWRMHLAQHPGDLRELTRSAWAHDTANYGQNLPEHMTTLLFKQALAEHHLTFEKERSIVRTPGSSDCQERRMQRSIARQISPQQQMPAFLCNGPLDLTEQLSRQ